MIPTLEVPGPTLVEQEPTISVLVPTLVEQEPIIAVLGPYLVEQGLTLVEQLIVKHNCVYSHKYLKINCNV
jgi:hypothetical protein